MTEAVVGGGTNARIVLTLFAAVLLIYFASHSGVLDSEDATPSTFIPVSVLGDGDLAFSPLEAPFMFAWGATTRDGRPVYLSVDRWDQLMPGLGVPAWRYYEAGLLKLRAPKYYLVPTKRQRPDTGEPLYASAFGPAAGLTALPIAAAAQALGLPLQRDQSVAYSVARLTAELLTAASVAMVFLTALAFVPRRIALLLAAAYGLGTCVWTISAHELWQQTPELFFLSLGVLCVVRGETAWVRGIAGGLAFSAAAVCRPTAAIVAIAAVAFLAISDRRSVAAFVLSAAPLTIALLGYNAYYFGSPLEFGQLVSGGSIANFKTGSSDVWQTPLWVGATGLLLSPSRGLLIYSPFLGAAFAGAVIAWRDKRWASLRFLTVAVPLLWAPAFLWFDWWGGWVYGYRPIVDSAPLLAVLCIPAVDRLWARAIPRYVLIAAIAWSILVQVLGTLMYVPADWNARRIGTGNAVANVDLPQYRSRLWSWSDWQIGYLIARCFGAQA